MAATSAADCYLLVAIRRPDQGRAAGVMAVLHALDDPNIVITVIKPETVSDMLLADIEKCHADR